jgi:hypothetical protein
VGKCSVEARDGEAHALEDSDSETSGLCDIGLDNP